MAETADVIAGLDWTDPPFGMAPIGQFLQTYNRQLSHAKPAMEDWWVFGGFLDELPSAEERRHAEYLLNRLAGASGDLFDLLCGDVEALAMPAWNRRMQIREATTIDELHAEQTGARLAGLAAIAAQLGWETGDDAQATGYGTRRRSWQFSPRGVPETLSITVRVGPPRSLEAMLDAVDLDFALAADEPPATAVWAAFRRLAQLTARAAESETLIDLPLIRRLDTLRQL